MTARIKTYAGLVLYDAFRVGLILAWAIWLHPPGWAVAPLGYLFLKESAL